MCSCAVLWCVLFPNRQLSVAAVNVAPDLSRSLLVTLFVRSLLFISYRLKTINATIASLQTQQKPRNGICSCTENHSLSLNWREECQQGTILNSLVPFRCVTISTKWRTYPRPDLFVGDLGPQMEMFSLRRPSKSQDKLLKCRLVRDTNILRSKGHIFASNALQKPWLHPSSPPSYYIPSCTRDLRGLEAATPRTQHCVPRRATYQGVCGGLANFYRKTFFFMSRSQV